MCCTLSVGKRQMGPCLLCNVTYIYAHCYVYLHLKLWLYLTLKQVYKTKLSSCTWSMSHMHKMLNFYQKNQKTNCLFLETSMSFPPSCLHLIGAKCTVLFWIFHLKHMIVVSINLYGWDFPMLLRAYLLDLIKWGFSRGAHLCRRSV